MVTLTRSKARDTRAVKNLNLTINSTTNQQQPAATTMSKTSSPDDGNVFPELSAESNLPENIDRRTFLIRHAVIGAAAAMTGTVWTAEARAQQATTEAAAKAAAAKSPLPPLDSTSMSQDLDVVKRSKGPIMTVLDEFYKV